MSENRDTTLPASAPWFTILGPACELTLGNGHGNSDNTADGWQEQSSSEGPDLYETLPPR